MSQFTIPLLSDHIVTHKKVREAYEKLLLLIQSIEPKPFPEHIKLKIQVCLDVLPVGTQEKNVLLKALKKSLHSIVKILEKEMKIVPKNYYTTIWTSLGLAVFGIPLGVAIGASFGNMAFLGIGFPFGIAIGIAVGVSMDKKAAAEGRQLQVAL